VLAAAAAGAGALALLLRDPHVHGAWGLCPFHALTGWYCPTCGGLRATADLLHGDLAGAWTENPVWVVTVPVLVVAWVVWVVRRWHGSQQVRWPRWPVWVAVGVYAVFGVVRNMPWFPLVPS